MLLSVKNVHFTFVLLRTHSFKAAILPLTEREVFTEKYRTEIFFSTDQARRARFVHKDQGPIFLCKDQASEVNNKFLYGIDRHLYLKQTRNA